MFWEKIKIFDKDYKETILIKATSSKVQKSFKANYKKNIEKVFKEVLDYFSKYFFWEYKKKGVKILI